MTSEIQSVAGLPSARVNCTARADDTIPSSVATPNTGG